MPIVWTWRRNRVSTLTGKRKSVSARSMAPRMIRKPRWKRWGWKRGKIRRNPLLSRRYQVELPGRRALGAIQKIADLELLHYQDYCPQGPSSRYSGLQEWGYTRRIDPDSKSVSYGDLMKPADCTESAVKYLEGLSTDATEEGEFYFFLPYASGSDYSGSTVEKANHKEFLESYGKEQFVWESHGGFDTYAVVLGLTGLLECADDTFDAILGIIEGLEDYPLIDDEALSNLESTLADEAWDCWVAGDFRRALEKKFAGVEFEWPSDSDLRPFFEKRAEKANEYWFNEGYGPDMYIRVDKIVEGIDLDNLAEYTLLFIVTYTDVGQETEEYTSESEAIERVDSLAPPVSSGQAIPWFPPPSSPVTRERCGSYRNTL